MPSSVSVRKEIAEVDTVDTVRLLVSDGPTDQSTDPSSRTDSMEDDFQVYREGGASLDPFIPAKLLPPSWKPMI